MQYGFVTIADVDGEEIFIDGSAMAAGAAPGPFRLPYGLHKFETHSTPQRSKITVIDRKALVVHFDPILPGGAA